MGDKTFLLKFSIYKLFISLDSKSNAFSAKIDKTN